MAELRRAGTIDYRDERVVGNIKYLWEANRHLHLVTLAQAHALTGDSRYALAVRSQVDSWIEQCPVGRGPNWVSALELGIRLINWSIAWQLLGGSRSRLFADEEGEAFRERWLKSVFEQARMIAGNLSRFSSANHLIGEAAGVCVAATTWPMWQQLRDWGEQCHEILEAECHRQNAPDGGNREQAFGYQTFVLDFLLVAGLAARARGEDFSPVYWRRLEVMIDFLASMTGAAGSLPMIGDADDAMVMRLSVDPGFSAHESLIATGALLFDRPRSRGQGGRDRWRKTVTLLGHRRDARRSRACASADARASSPVSSLASLAITCLAQLSKRRTEVRLLADAGHLVI